MKLLVLADDFTGALDTGVQFAQTGAATWVALGPEPDYSAIPPETQVLAADTESRHLPPAEAARKVRRIALAAVREGIAHIYKKTDSTLRGNIGAELKAVMDAAGGGPAMFVPAYPAAGRTTAGGRQYVRDEPLEQTSFASDPLNPVMTGDISEILRSQADVRVISVRPDNPPQAYSGRDTVYVFDGGTDEDLARTGKLLKDAGCLRITAGCAGFAAHLAGLMDFQRGVPPKPMPPKNILLVCGSVNERSLRQLEHAEALGYAILTPEAGQLADAAYWNTEDGRKAIRQAAEKLNGGGRLLVRSTPPGSLRLSPSGGANTAIAQGLGRLASGILEQAAPCTLAAFGGDTAMGVMAALGCAGLMPLEEIEPGVALSVMHCSLGRVCLVSKAGGFGSEKVLDTIDEYLRRNSP